MDIYQERIRPLFDRAPETNAEIERKLGIPPRTINKWNTTPLKSYNKYIPQIAAYFHVSTDYLLGNTDDPTPAGQEKAPTHESERELPHAEYREVLAEGGMRLLMDADAKIPEEHVEEIVEFIKMKQRKYGR